MRICSQDFAGRVAEECRDAAIRLVRLQDTIGEEIAAQDVTGRMVRELQALDQISQTLVDLGEVFSELALSNGGPVSLGTIAVARQLALRQRLTGEANIATSDGDELF